MHCGNIYSHDIINHCKQVYMREGAIGIISETESQWCLDARCPFIRAEKGILLCDPLAKFQEALRPRTLRNKRNQPVLDKRGQVVTYIVEPQQACQEVEALYSDIPEDCLWQL